ncbi:hypothetical protein [Pseudoxanthomonas mexicana]|uniref:hypothetical protein n=1 Tax=Pseudoxanthomonas mexicana TaxID=128785 RepID=UPI00398A85D7
MPDNRFLVVRAEHIAGSSAAFEGLEEALGHAGLKTKSDKEPRYVVQVLAHVSPDPVPAVVITRFDEGTSNEEQAL